jgi:hypothetical protein
MEMEEMAITMQLKFCILSEGPVRCSGRGTSLIPRIHFDDSTCGLFDFKWGISLLGKHRKFWCAKVCLTSGGYSECHGGLYVSLLGLY